MFCSKCGNENNDNAKFCTSCGINLGSTSMTFVKAISVCMTKYFDFNGRASRSEFWWFYLFFVILILIADLLDRTKTISRLINLGLAIPIFSVAARRLHDTNRSGWWQLLSITIIGLIPVIVWLTSKGDEHENKYGNLLK